MPGRDTPVARLRIRIVIQRHHGHKGPRSFIGDLDQRTIRLGVHPERLASHGGTAIRSKNTRQLSLPMYVMFVSGVALWIYYGIRSEQLPIILGNAITFVLAGTILAYKLRNRSKEKRFL